jgi:hypothetical protein
VFGKPLVWTRGWTVVCLIWFAAALLLGVLRLQMGHVAAFDQRELAAIGAVQDARLDGGPRYGDLLDFFARRVGPEVLGGSEPGWPRWYTFDRPWEHRVYVVWEYGRGFALDFFVEGGAVHPDDRTVLVLKRTARLAGGQ